MCWREPGRGRYRHPPGWLPPGPLARRKAEVPRCCRMQAGACSGRWQQRPACQQPKCGWHGTSPCPGLSVSSMSVSSGLFSSWGVFMNTMHVHARSPQKPKPKDFGGRGRWQQLCLRRKIGRPGWPTAAAGPMARPGTAGRGCARGRGSGYRWPGKGGGRAGLGAAGFIGGRSRMQTGACGTELPTHVHVRDMHDIALRLLLHHMYARMHMHTRSYMTVYSSTQDKDKH